MPVTDPTSSEPRRFSIRLPRPLWFALAAVGLVAFGSVLTWKFLSWGREFDQQLWHDCEDLEATGNPRLGMADRLISMGTLRDTTRDKVVEMLGEPPETTYFREWDLVYWLGPERGFISIDSEWLVFRLDQQGRVAEYRIVRD